MALCATRMLRDGRLRNRTLVATVMSNLGLERALRAEGGALVRTPVGDRYVVEAMRQGGHNLGGEQSGHLVFLDHSTTGDGIVAALQVLALVLREGRPLSELGRDAMQRVPQVLENVSLPRRRPIEDMASLSRSMRRVQAELGTEGRLLVRWSGTEAKLRIMIEGPDEARLQEWSQEMAEAARRDLSAGGGA
jgi:phosphoglucosamine mutase